MYAGGINGKKEAAGNLLKRWKRIWSKSNSFAGRCDDLRPNGRKCKSCFDTFGRIYADQFCWNQYQGAIDEVSMKILTK